MINDTAWELTTMANHLLSDDAQCVINQWLSDFRFLDESGSPSMLVLAGYDHLSFAALVHQAGYRGRATSILEELMAKGVIEQAPPDRVLLCRAVYTPSQHGSNPNSERQYSGEAL